MNNLNEKKVAQEGLVQEQLSREELECIYRHLKMFVQTSWHKIENVPNACDGCNKYCSEVEHVLDVWPTFHKLANIVELPAIQLLVKKNTYIGSEGDSK